MKKLTVIVILALAIYSTGFAQDPPHELRSIGQTVLDTETGLQWIKDPSQFERMTWENARDFVANLSFGGYTDWRLPGGLNPDGTLCNSQPSGLNCPETELGHLYFQHYLQAPAGQMSPFENYTYKVYWTSTEFPGDTTKAMTQDFTDGGNNPSHKTSTYHVWPVRKAQIRWVHHPIWGWLLLIMVVVVIPVSIFILRKRRAKKVL